MSDKTEWAYNLLKPLLQGPEAPTITEIQEAVRHIADFLKKTHNLSFDDSELEEVANLYERNVGVKAFMPETLVSDDMQQTWFLEKKNDPEQQLLYWNRYEDYLRYEKDFDEDTIKVLKISTEEILGYCANPNSRNGIAEKRRGLVVGDVQSGKTANYLALINMACDYGYRLFVVLAGLTDSLRRQTQERIDEGLIGAISNTIGSDRIAYVGVGKQRNDRFAVTLTNLDKDFKKESLFALNSTSSDYNKPVILVVKKNKRTLENVREWLKPGTEGVTDHIMIIDDEADNASVNTKKDEEDPSAINSLIRDLFNNFPVSSYVGYTATPFANIFINPDDEQSYKDLYPSNFITLLKTPTSYFGATKVFGPKNDGNTRYIRRIDEDEINFLPVNHKKDDPYFELADSLKEAILVFFINSVIRSKRGKPTAHRTMMINISRFNNMQTKIKNKVLDYVVYLKQVISQTSYLSKENFLKNSEMLKMYNIYSTDDYYNDIRNEISWDKIQEGLGFEAERMKVIVTNRLKDEEKLDYKSFEGKGARYIVIGGFVLSRGLTLEGLMISYYSRNGSAYDTLLQMCRWFGYRPGYEDLCRIYMSNINVENFCAVVDATNDLKRQFSKMKREHKTPNDFGLMVKTCPDILNTLLVTSRNKSRSTKDKTFVLNYCAQSVDTSKLFFDKNQNEKHLNLIRDTLEQNLGKLTFDGKRYMYRNVDKKIIISLLKELSIPLLNTKFDVLSICEFLSKTERLNRWDVVIATGHKNTRKFHFGGYEIDPVERSFDYRSDSNEPFVRIAGNNNRLIDPGILDSGLSSEVIAEIKAKVGEGKTPSATDYLERRSIPILIIYPIILLNKDNNVAKQKIINQLNNECLIGFGIGFPYNGERIEITYKLNVRRQQELVDALEELQDEE